MRLNSRSLNYKRTNQPIFVDIQLQVT